MATATETVATLPDAITNNRYVDLASDAMEFALDKFHGVLSDAAHELATTRRDGKFTTALSVTLWWNEDTHKIEAETRVSDKRPPHVTTAIHGHKRGDQLALEFE